MQRVLDHAYGLVELDFWGYVTVSLLMLQFTIIGVTLYLHRDQAHRAVDLHPLVRHAFRFWLWFGTAMNTREWVAVHRKHHARCETDEDPHSPVSKGLRRVLLQGAELYREEALKPETQEKYGRGTPEDWIQCHLYDRFHDGGVVLFSVACLLLFGVPGIIMIAVQLASMPLFAAGVINGLGHHTGYRNFETDDASTNIVPWGVVLGGEELHNNHHAFPSSARFSIRRWELDLGWGLLSIFRLAGLARIKKVAPRLQLDAGRDVIDLDTVRALIVNRMHVLRAYTRSVTIPVFRSELRQLGASESNPFRRAKRLLVRNAALLDEASRQRLAQVLERSHSLRTVHEFRERLQALWNTANVSNDRLIVQLREWCLQAEASGIKALEDFADNVRAYRLAALPA